MSHHRHRIRLLALLLSLAAPLAALADEPLHQPQPKPQPEAQGAPAPAPAVTAMTLTLGEAIHLGLEKHPRLAAKRASLAAAQDGAQALDDLRVPGFVAPELPIRRKQAALGIDIATAAVHQTEHEVAYAITRTYFTVVYAREQERVARSVVTDLRDTRDIAKRFLDAGDKDINSRDVDRATAYLQLAEARRIEATEGIKRARAALREAIGLGCDVTVDVPAGGLPELQVELRAEDVIAAALARRGDLIRVGLFAEIVCLEIDSQATSLLKRMDTFAAGADIHSAQVPQSLHNTEYRPGGIPPEMPSMLVGPKADRVKHAQDLFARATAVVAETRNLITLEAENAFLQWEQASQQAAAAKEGANTAEAVARGLKADYRDRTVKNLQDVVNAQVLAGTARSQANEYLYRAILALADLERVTAGGFCARLVEAATPRVQPAEGGKQ